MRGYDSPRFLTRLNYHEPTDEIGLKQADGRFKMKTLIALFALLAASAGMAQDYRCMDDRGEYWSTSPCRAGEEHPGARRTAPARRSSVPLEITSAMEIDGATYCGVAVEKLARVDFKWTSWTGRFGGAVDVGDGTIMFRGDQIEMQNGFGNWIRHKYVCVYDPIAKKVVNAAAEPGRF